MVGQTIQINFDSLCDSAYTTSDLNECTYKQYQKLDSIILYKNDCISKFIEKQIKNFEKDYDTASIYYYKKVLTSVKNSQEKWNELMRANLDFYNYYYYSGSISSMEINLSGIKDAKDRISRLDDFIETLEQGNEKKICK